MARRKNRPATPVPQPAPVAAAVESTAEPPSETSPQGPLPDGLYIRAGDRSTNTRGTAGELWEVLDGKADVIDRESDDYRDLMDNRPRLRDAIIATRQRNLG